MRDLCARVWIFLASFVRHRWGFRFADRAALTSYQQRRLRRFRAAEPQAPFYRGRAHETLDALPFADKQTMLGAFEAFNTQGITLGDARRLAFEAESTRDFRPTLGQGLTVGTSSGTSGRPNLFLVSKLEMAQWAGALLGRMLSSGSLRRVLNPCAAPLRIAFFLRANSNLYTSLDGGRIRFRFFDLVRPLHAHLEALNQCQPHILVAPASVLRFLAEAQRTGLLSIAPAQVINVAESLEPDDAGRIAAVFGRTVQQIYQCTEGVLGFSCDAGAVHLNEECVLFEPQWLDAERTRFTAAITDFSRSTQMFVRFRMDDILHLDRAPCACGRVTMRLQSIEGRLDDVLWLPDQRSDPVLQPVFPDQIRRAVMIAVPDCRDYRIEQHGLRVTFSTVDGRAADQAALLRALRELFDSLGVRAAALEPTDWHAAPTLQKRRRIRCIARPQAMVRSA